METAEYTKIYFDDHLEKYLGRSTNHQAIKITAIKELTQGLEFDSVLDLGACIGTFALEYASEGKTAIALDMSPVGLHYGKRLAEEMNLGDKTHWISADAASIPLQDECIDLILAEDIVEHLVPDVLHSALKECNRILKSKGTIVIHTFPTKYDYILEKIEKRNLTFLLRPFSLLPDAMVRWSFYLLDKFVVPPWFLIRHRKTRKSVITREIHCNVQSLGSLKRELKRADFDILTIYGTNLYEQFFPKKYFKMLSHSQVSKRNLIAIARKKAE